MADAPAGNLREPERMVWQPLVDPPHAERAASLAGRAKAEAGTASWVGKGASVDVHGFRIGGLVYVGQRFPRGEPASGSVSCLVDPRLEVARHRRGPAHFPYWPSYAELNATARRAYLEWLAGPRSDPGTDPGIVFVYFYGLERRLMVDAAADDRAEVVAEVGRLLDVFHEVGAFRHRAERLLAAVAFRDGAPAELAFRQQAEVPWPLRHEIGRLCRDGLPIPPDLLLAIVMSHPESRVRTPAVRALPMMRELFASELAARHPSGLRMPRGRGTRDLVLTYRVAGSETDLEVRPGAGDVPDVLAGGGPLSLGRELLEQCTAALDPFSRELGRSGRTAPTLAAIAKLPLAIRGAAAGRHAPEALAEIAGLASSGAVTSLGAVRSPLGLAATDGGGRAVVAETAALLRRLGYGIVPDPDFTAKATYDGSKVVAFELGENDTDEVATVSEAYRVVHLSLMMGTIVAASDGRVDDAERAALAAIADGATLDANERARLHADRLWFEATGPSAADLRAAVRKVDPDGRRRILDAAVAVASADGLMAEAEVAVLERLAKQWGLDATRLYGSLHASAAPMAQPAATTGAIDARRLAALREETLGAAGILDELFADDDPHPESRREIVADDAVAGDVAGLEHRHAGLLSELCTRQTWPKAEFERLARERGLMPGAARQAINDWSMDMHDELLLEGDGEVEVNVFLVPGELLAPVGAPA